MHVHRLPWRNDAVTYSLAILLMVLAAGALLGGFTLYSQSIGTGDMTLASRQRGFGNLCMLGNLTCVVLLFLIAVF